MREWLNKANVYILAWCIYSTQGILFPKGTLFTQLLLVILLVVSLYYLWIANTRYKLPLYFYGLNTLLGMFFVYGIYLILGGYNSGDYAIPVQSFNYLQRILISLVPIYPLYVFSKEGLINEKNIRIWFFVLFVMAVGNYYKHQKELLYMALLRGSDAEEFTNNMGYEFVKLIPFCVFLYKRPILQYVALGACMVFLFMAMKRGAIIIGVLSILWFVGINLKNVSFKKKIVFLVLSVVLCFVGYRYVDMQMRESFYFQKRVENTLEGNSSGRDKLYSRFVDYFVQETTPLQFAFGSGANATLKVSFNYAHNDWLEIAVNQGVLGIVVYIFYWIMFLKTILSKLFSSRERLVLQLVLLAAFMETLFSMSYTSMGYVTMLIMGYCLAQEKKNEQVVYGN